jgi:ribose transport system substrate-binding protein
MKKFALIIFVLIFAFTFASCSGKGSDSDSDSKNKNISLTSGKENTDVKSNSDTSKKYKIGLVMKTLTNPFFIEMEKGARKAETEFGLQLIVKTGAKETSIEQQIKIVENMINDKIDAIVIAPGSSTELIPVLKRAQDAGISIVNIDNRLDRKLSKEAGLSGVPFISVDNEKAAYLSAKYISDKVKTPAEAVIIEGIRGADNAEQRKMGAIRAFKGNPNIKVVAMETANWKIDEGYSVIKKIFVNHPKTRVIFCANDMMALGVVHYIQEFGKKNILIAGFDNLEEARKATKIGEMQVTVDQKPSEQGYIGVKSAVQLLKGEKVSLETMINVEIINKAKIK